MGADLTIGLLADRIGAVDSLVACRALVAFPQTAPLCSGPVILHHGGHSAEIRVVREQFVKGPAAGNATVA